MRRVAEEASESFGAGALDDTASEGRAAVVLLRIEL